MLWAILLYDYYIHLSMRVLVNYQRIFMFCIKHLPCVRAEER